jgi:hypothetical protein
VLQVLEQEQEQEQEQRELQVRVQVRVQRELLELELPELLELELPEPELLAREPQVLERPQLEHQVGLQ